jgi:hypothetical protein
MKNDEKKKARFRREKRKIHQFKHRAGYNDNHHLTPKCRGGESIRSNLLNMDCYKHDALHLLFGNRTLEEIIEFLQEIKRRKDKEYDDFFHNE